MPDPLGDSESQANGSEPQSNDPESRSNVTLAAPSINDPAPLSNDPLASEPHAQDQLPPSPPFSGIGRKRAYIEPPMSPVRDEQGNVVLAPRVRMTSNSIRADFKLAPEGDEQPVASSSSTPLTQVQATSRLQAMSYAALEKYSTFGLVVRQPM